MYGYNIKILNNVLKYLRCWLLMLGRFNVSKIKLILVFKVYKCLSVIII